MNPDAFIPFYGDEFFQAVKGQPDHIALGYMKCIWHHWSHMHCRGLRDDQEFLRKICEIDREQWPDSMAVIFDNDKFFTLGEDGMWYQKRACELWREAKANYDRKVNQTAAASAARWGKKK